MGNVVMEATQINYRRDEKLKTVDQKLQELSQESAIDTDIAPVFKSTNTYHPGDLVYYRNKLYAFTAEHTGAWAAGDVTDTDVSTAMNAALAGKADYADIAGAFSSETAYTAGDLVIYNGIIYRCTNDHTGEWDADDFSATTIGAELNAINSNFVNFKNALSPVGNSIHQGDLNDITDTCNIATIGTNAPVAGVFNLHTMRTLTTQNDIWATQIAVAISGDYTGRVYIRSFMSNTWSLWREIDTTAVT